MMADFRGGGGVKQNGTKSDIIYACSLILYELFQSRWNILLVQTGLGVIQKIKGNKNLIPSIRSGQNF